MGDIQTNDQTNNENPAFEEWKKLSLDLQLKDWSDLTKKVFNYDCGFIALAVGGFITSGITWIIMIGGVGTVLGARAKLANDQQQKLAYFYEIYRKGIEEACRLQSTSTTGLIFNLAYTAVESFSKMGTTPAPNPAAQENDLIKIINAIGPYLTPEEVTVWTCAHAQVPTELKTAIRNLGIFEKSETQLMASAGAQLSYQYSTKDKKNTYSYCPKNSDITGKVQRQGRLSFYGHNNTATKILSPVGYASGACMDGVQSFVSMGCQQLLPTLNGAVDSTVNIMSRRRQ